MLSVVKKLSSYLEWNTRYAVLGMVPNWSYLATLEVCNFWSIKFDQLESKEFKQAKKTLYKQLCGNIFVGAFYIAFGLATLGLLISAIPSLIINVIVLIYIPLKFLADYALIALKYLSNKPLSITSLNHPIRDTRLTFLISPLRSFAAYIYTDLKGFLFFLQKSFESYKFYKTLFVIYILAVPTIALLSWRIFIKIKQHLSLKTTIPSSSTTDNINHYFYVKHVLMAPSESVANFNFMELENEKKLITNIPALPNDEQLIHFKALVLTVFSGAGLCVSFAPIPTMLGSSQQFFETTKTLLPPEEAAVKLVHNVCVRTTQVIENWCS